ncbi:MerR family transcriptional regulator [Actinorugispora endophytica]|uniref:MerR family transcriptional regulator/heat shock protein HspR n=1 Tax=Actinorugispora endophytica TaxID=1605990 RepID=A0A4R6V4J5_9ACTN|nr:MerR family transcriptional regulator [Actinorugispora endophytica]TDQ55251.1 MerR family transcriptional regulator/heat shock protein HspR [Actinorugispora endophytica]
MTPDHPDPDRALYTISVAAQLAGVSPRTLRSYENLGLLAPTRTSGGTRLYSDNDIVRSRRVTALVDQGVNLAGVRRILDLQDENTRLREADTP